MEDLKTTQAENSIKKDKTIPSSQLFQNPFSQVEVYNPEGTTAQEKFPGLLPKESTSEQHLLTIQALPSFERLRPHTYRPIAPNLYGAGKLLDAQHFAEDYYSEWNVDSISTRQIRKLINRMYVS